MDIALLSINYQNDHHTPDPQPEGGMVRAFVAGRDDEHLLPARFADMRCQHYAWRHCKDYGALGFHGYRKHIDFRDVRPDVWNYCSVQEFRDYQRWLTEWDGMHLRNILKHHSVVATPPFYVDCGMAEDFRQSRSKHDWCELEAIMSQYGNWPYQTRHIHGTFWIMRQDVFQEFMELWWKVIEQLVPRLDTADNSRNDYRARDVAFLSERIASLWIQRHTDRLKPLEMPLLISWGVT